MPILQQYQNLGSPYGNVKEAEWVSEPNMQIFQVSVSCAHTFHVLLEFCRLQYSIS